MADVDAEDNARETDDRCDKWRIVAEADAEEKSGH